MVFPKTVALGYDLSCIIGKDDISFSRKYDHTPWTKNERWSLSKKIHGNMIFSSNVLKRLSFLKTCAGTWAFLYYLERWYFFPENIFFFWTENERRPFSRNTQKHDIFCRTFFRYKNVLERIPVFFCTFVETFIGVFICCSSAKKTRRLNT